MARLLSLLCSAAENLSVASRHSSIHPVHKGFWRAYCVLVTWPPPTPPHKPPSVPNLSASKLC